MNRVHRHREFEPAAAVCDSSFNVPTPACSWIRIAFHACPESSIGFQVMVHFPLHSSLDSVLLEPLSVASLTMSRSDKPSLMGKRDDQSRVAIWTECQRMDMLLTESRIFLCRRDTESITASLAARNRNPQAI